MKNQQNINRFSNRVENYVNYRPGYPSGIVMFLKNECNLEKNSIIADIGSGTGISARLFLENGYKVFAVEPNFEMRMAAEEILKSYENFISINGTAENSNLNDKSVDFIVCGQAFHWFDFEKCKAEFKRILKNDGYTVLIWNSRISIPGFMDDYENLLRKFGTDYENVNHDNIDESVIKTFFSPSEYELKTFPNYQDFDYDGLKGRLLSSSYVPLEESQDFADMIAELKRIFLKNQRNGIVRMEYKTVLYIGKLC